MSVVVTLHIYSGVPDPSWELDDKQAKQLVSKIRKLPKSTLMKPPGIVGGLGYRGFSIQAVREKDIAPQMYLHSGILDQERFDMNLMAEDAELEKWLLSTAGEAIDKDLADFVGNELSALGQKGALATTAPPLALTPPPYNPGKWNSDPNIQRRNNCYNYANDKITNTFAQPGRGSGKMYTALNCASVGKAAVSDGQIAFRVPFPKLTQGHIIALVNWPNRDYHWYRLDKGGWWSHKPGQTPARNTDNSGTRIKDPRKCNRGPYTSWCGFYHCIPRKVRII